MVYRYPYNLFNDMGLKSSSGGVLNLDNDDLVGKFSENGYIKEEVAQVLSKKYKEYKTHEGISIECDLEVEDVTELLSSGLTVLKEGYSFAKETNFWTRYLRTTKVASLPIQEIDKNVLKVKGYNTLGDIKNSPDAYMILSSFCEESRKCLEEILSKTPLGNVSFVIIRGNENDDSIVEGVLVEQGKPLKVHKGILRDVRPCVSEVVSAVVPEKGEGTVGKEEVAKEKKKKPEEDKRASKEKGEKNKSKKSKDAEKKAVEDVMVEDTQEEDEYYEPIVFGSDPIAKYIPRSKARLLIDCDIISLEDLAMYSKEDILSIPGMGKRTVDSLGDYMAKAGLSYCEKVEEDPLPDMPEESWKSDGVKAVDIPDTSKTLFKKDDEQSRLPDDFLLYVRGRENLDLAKMSEGEIVGVYGDFLKYEERNLDFSVYKRFLGTMKEKTPLSLISVMEKYKGGIFDKDAEKGRTENLCFTYYMKVYSEMLSKASYVKELFSQLCKKVLSTDGKLDIQDAYNFCSRIESSVSEEVCWKIYTQVYTKDTNLGERLVARVRNHSKRYVGDIDLLTEELHMLRLYGSLAVIVDDWCRDRGVSYDCILPEIRMVVKKFNAGTLNYSNVSEAVEDLLTLYNGNFGLMSVVSEKFPKYR